MSQLSTLVKTALLGTAREPLPEITQDTPLAQLLGQLRLNEVSPERQLLSVAGAVSLHTQVGLRPQRQSNGALISDHPDHAAKDDWQPCNPQTTRRLAVLLNGRFEALLPELLAMLVQAKRHVPAEFLPDLLDYGARISAPRQSISQLISPAGRWLAKQRPKWAYASLEAGNWDDLITIWKQSESSYRQALLRHMRYRDPARGRQLVEHSWATATPSERVTLIRSLEVGLSIADEPLLERTLDDREYTVRRKAAEILTRLPDSRLCQRMTTNTEPLLSWTPGQAYQITVTFPAEISPAMMRDGVLNRPGKDMSRIRSAQLVEIISAIPLTHWTANWGVSVADIIAAVQTSRWPRTLIRAFAQAAERQGNTTWANAMIDHDPCYLNTMKLVAILPTSDFDRLVAQLSQSTQPLNKDHCLVRVLRRWPHDWSKSVTEIWFDLLGRHIADHADEEKLDSTLVTAMRQCARSCPPDLAETAKTTLLPYTKSGTIWWTPVQEMISILTFRRDMLAEVKR